MLVAQQGRAVDRRRDEVARLKRQRVQHRRRGIVANQARRPPDLPRIGSPLAE
jgi:hypothetical protein